MCFVLFRILQHDVRRKSPKLMCYHRILLTNTFCIQHCGCMLLAKIIQMSEGSGFSSDVNLYLFRIVSYCISYFCWFFRVCQFHFVFFASHVVFHFVCVRTTDKNEQLTWTLFRILNFVWYFVCISYAFRIVSCVFVFCRAKNPDAVSRLRKKVQTRVSLLQRFSLEPASWRSAPSSPLLM